MTTDRPPTPEERACTMQGVSFKTFSRLRPDHPDRIKTQRYADELRTALAEMAGKLGVATTKWCNCNGPETVRHMGCEACGDSGSIDLTTDEMAEAIRDKYVTKAGAIDVAQGAAQLVIVKLAMMFKLELDVDGTVEQAGEAIQRAFVQQVAGMLGVEARERPVHPAGRIRYRTQDEVLVQGLLAFYNYSKTSAIRNPHALVREWLARNTKGGA